MPKEFPVLDQAVWAGVNVLLDQYVDVQAHDHVVIAYTEDSRECAAWVCVALEARGIASQVLAMEPLVDWTLEERLRALLPSAEGGNRLVIITFELHTMSHTPIFRKVVEERGAERCVVVRAMSACAELFSRAMVSPSMLSALNNALLDRFIPATTLKITAPGGTDLTVTLDSGRYRWISNCAHRRPGSFMILPAGEVATYPASIDGTLVADFALHVNMHTELDVRLARSPVSVDVKAGRVAGYHCDDSAIASFISQCLDHEGADAVGELGFGTNFGVQAATAVNSHINERVPGVHLGFGQHNQRGILPSVCEIHMDLIARGGRVWCDDDNDTPLDLEQLAPSQADHTQLALDEDVFSPEVSSDDCCGRDIVCAVQ